MTTDRVVRQVSWYPTSRENERDVGHPIFVAGIVSPSFDFPSRHRESAARDDNSVELLALGFFASFRRSKKNRMSPDKHSPQMARDGARAPCRTDRPLIPSWKRQAGDIP
jgi:hypothetical protein